MELLKVAAPRVTQAAFLFNPATAPYAQYYLNPFKAAAGSFGVEAITAPVHDASELESAITALADGFPGRLERVHGCQLERLTTRSHS